jgi:hypothetical protein
MLASLLFPYDDDAGVLMGNWLSELENQGCIRVYEVQGSQYLQIMKWSAHQKIDKPSKPQHPSFEDSLDDTLEYSRDTRERSSEEGKGREGTKEGEGREGSAEGENPPTDLLGQIPSQAKVDEVQAVVDAYHRILPKCQRITVLNDKRRKRVLAVVKIGKSVCKSKGWQYDGESFFTAYFEECSKDPWLRGEVPNPKNASWKQNLDCLLAEDRFAKILDQAFDGADKP